VYFSVEGRPLEKLPYINISLPEPTTLGADQVSLTSHVAFVSSRVLALQEKFISAHVH